jgi:alpha-D-ribose 1-methylphosphonate 5-triphosphate synthase subunit PhnH
MASTGLAEQTRYSATTFRHLLDSLARPGKINHLEYPHFLGEPPCYYAQASATDVPVNLYALGAVLTLLDREVTFAVAASGQWLPHAVPIVQWLTLRSGSTCVTPEAAMFAFFCEGKSAGLVTQLNRGTLLEPESSTTAFYCVERLLEQADALSDEDAPWVALELTGPGIELTHTLSVEGMDRAEIAQINVARRSYPLGIDVCLIDAVGRCVGLPRTTRIRIMR